MGSYYNITTKYENAIYERGDSNYFVVDIKDIDASTHVNPSTVSITIYDPCLTKKVSDVAMTLTATGVYAYSYDIPVDAVYGEYEIEVTTSSPTYTAIYKDKFYILPWNAIYDVRRYSGIISKKSVSDHDIAGIIWEAYKEALEEVYTYHHNETPKCNPDTGAWFDGVNTTFATEYGPLADHDGDGSIVGWGEQSCGTDVYGWWKDVDGNCHRANVTVNESHCGNIDITQTDGTAIPSSACWVHIDYWTEFETYDETLFRKAVAYLAAHKCIVRFKELGKATQADLYSNKQVILDERNRMEKEYKGIMRQIKKPVIGAGMLPGE